MPLEPCPTCGYALSVLDHHCRHCASALPVGPTVRLAVKSLPQIIMALASLGLLSYFISLHGFSGNKRIQAASRLQCSWPRLERRGETSGGGGAQCITRCCAWITRFDRFSLARIDAAFGCFSYCRDNGCTG